MASTLSTSPVPLVSDAGRIELRHDLDAAYWCRLFAVSPAELRSAVQRVGPQAVAVRRYFARANGAALPAVG